MKINTGDMETFQFNGIDYYIRIRRAEFGYTGDVYRANDNKLWLQGDMIYYDPDECIYQTQIEFYDYASDSLTS